MATRRVELGPTGETVRANIRRFREEQGWRLDDLATLIRHAGRPMSKTTLSQIETGGRRVDVDDLMALSHVLGVNPNALLMPALAQADDWVVRTTGSRNVGSDWVSGRLLLEWLEGRTSIKDIVPPVNSRLTPEDWDAWNRVEWERRIHGPVGGQLPNRIVDPSDYEANADPGDTHAVRDISDHG
jgi:transcriptional regulator with XRE-family HTH domain